MPALIDRIAASFDAVPLARSSTGDLIYQAVISAVEAGDLKPGERVTDSHLATRLGVSRTPVREALQRLREVGVVESSSHRYTRIALVRGARFVHALAAARVLYSALVRDVCGGSGVPGAVLATMIRSDEQFAHAMRTGDRRGALIHAFGVLEPLPALSRNSYLRRCIESVTHAVRLGVVGAADLVDGNAVHKVNQELLTGLSEGDVERCDRALVRLEEILRRAGTPRALSAVSSPS